MTESKVKCGLVMPISSMDGYGAEHWAEVRKIVESACDSLAEPRFAVKMVSEDDAIGVIQKRIVQNLYSSEIVYL